MKIVSKVVWLLAAVSLLAVSCMVKEPEQDGMLTDAPKITATVGVESPSTKVSATESDGQTRQTIWEKGDEIAVFMHNARALKYALDGEGGESVGEFSYVSGSSTGLQFPQVYGVYPYDRSYRLSGSVVTLTFPGEQKYREGLFDPKANLMVAASETNDLFFRNVGGYLVICLYGADVSVSKVVVTGNEDEPLAGPAEVWVSEDIAPDIDFSEETALTEVSLVCATPVDLGETADEATEFWFVLPPTDFEEGLSIRVEMADGSVFEASTENWIELLRNNVYRLDPLCVASVEAGFTAEIAWEYSEDAEVDHEQFYEGPDASDYGRAAVPLTVDASVIEKFGDELDGITPDAVTVTCKDDAGDDVDVSDEVVIDDVTVTDGVLTVSVTGFAWDKTYSVTIEKLLSSSDLVLSGTLTTVDRAREPIVLETVNGYTFTLGEYDDDSGYGYSGDATGDGSGWYYWDGNDLSGEIFAAFQSAGLVTDEDCPDVESFASAELGGNVVPADPASIPEGVTAYVSLSTDMYLYTTDTFKEAILTGNVFSSGAPSTSDPEVVQGNTLYLCFTTYLGQEVQVPFAFSYYGEAAPTPDPAVLYEEDFEDNFVQDRMPGWTFFDADGDDYNWTFAPFSIANGYDRDNGRNGSLGYLASASYINNIGVLSPDNWAVTPAITLDPAANYLSFWVAPVDITYRNDYVEVYVTTSDQPSSNPDDYISVYGGTLTSTTYTQVVIKLDDSFNGKTVHIAFRHYNSVDVYWYMVDDIMVTNYDPNPDLEVIFSANLDDGDFSGWLSYDADGDGDGWGYDVTVFHGDSDSGVSFMSVSYDGNSYDPDNWLISPGIELGSESYQLRFWARSYDSSWPDHYGVYIAEYPDDFEALVSNLMSSDPLFDEVAAEEWHQVVITIPAEFKGKTICLFFRHYNSADNYYLFLDDFEVVVASGSSPSPAPARGNDAVRKRVAPKQAAPGLKKADIPALRTFPLPAWKK